MSNSAFSPSVLTIPSGTTGSGQGELNLVTNPVAASDLSGWVGAGRGTSGGPLNPTIETYFTVLNTAGSESSTSGAYDVISLPSGLQNKKLKVEFYFTSPAVDTFKVSVYKGTTRVPLTTDVAGSTSLPKSTTGKFVAYFDTDSSGTWTVSITRTAGTGATALQFTNVVVGPGIQPQGAVVGEWTDFTPGSFVNTPPATTLTLEYAKYRRSGDLLTAKIRYKVAIFNYAGSAQAANVVTLNRLIPSGLTIPSSFLSNRNAFGTVGAQVTNTTAYNQNGYAVGFIEGDPTTGTYRFLLSNKDTATTGFGGTSLLWGAFGSPSFADTNGGMVDMEFTVPIAEWAGSGTVQLAQNDVEYAYNTSTSTTVSDTNSFGYGPGGAQIKAIANLVTRRVRFQTPIQTGDKLVIEVSSDSSGTNWMPLEFGGITDNTTFRISSYQRQNALSYGIGNISRFSTTDVDVTFGAYACEAGSGGFAAAGEAWGTAGGNRYWRVRKSSAGAAVGFGIVQPGVSSGLVSAAGLPGNTTGNAIASGYVGEVITLGNASLFRQSNPVFNTAYTVTGLGGTISTPGVYNVVISGFGEAFLTSNAQSPAVLCNFTNSPSITGTQSQRYSIAAFTGFEYHVPVTINLVVRVTSSTVLSIVVIHDAYKSASPGTPSMIGFSGATAYAVRIA